MKKNMMKSVKIFLILSLLFFLGGCAKAPETVHSPGIKIDLEIKNNSEKYTVRFSGGIRNENPQTAFVNFSAVANIVNSSKKNVISFPVEFKTILPFKTAIVEKKIVLNEKEIQPVIDALNINIKKLQENKTTGGSFIDEKNITLEKVNFDKKDIIDLLEERINEKN